LPAFGFSHLSRLTSHISPFPLDLSAAASPFARAMADRLAKEDLGVFRRSVVGSVGGDGDVGVSLPVVGDAGGVGDVGVSNG